MKALVQRVKRGRVTVGETVTGEVSQGLVVLLGVKRSDAEEDARYLAAKTLGLRIFSDDEGKMNLSVQDVDGSLLVVSQFTLYANTRKGNRPSFVDAAPPEQADALYRLYVAELQRVVGEGRVATGAFGRMMVVEIINDGPVTIELTTDRP